MSVSECPTEETLYAIMAGDEDVFKNTHVANCDQCQNHLRKLQTENTVLRNVHEVSDRLPIGSKIAGFPGSIGKFIVVGVWDNGPSFITYRGLHSVVRRDVLIQVAKVPLCESPIYQQEFRSKCGRWIQLRPHVAAFLDAGEYESRPYIVIAYNDEVRLDRLIVGSQLDASTIMQIFGQIAKSLAADAETPHRELRTSSIVLDDDNQPTLVDWAAAAEFSAASGEFSKVSRNDTSHRLGIAFCEALFSENLTTTLHSKSLTYSALVKALRSRNITLSAAELIATAVAGDTAQKPSLAELANTLLRPVPRSLWQRLVRR